MNIIGRLKKITLTKQKCNYSITKPYMKIKLETLK